MVSIIYVKNCNHKTANIKQSSTILDFTCLQCYYCSYYSVIIMSNLNDSNPFFSGVFSNLTNMRFPLKVYHMLECGNYNHIINWLPDGASFSILDEALLVRDVLPHYCPGGRFETFIRQLNKYGFETLEKRRKSDIGRMFSSSLFIRGREDQLLTMQRTGAKSSSKAKAEVAPSGPSKRSKPDSPTANQLASNDSSIIGSYLSSPSLHNIPSFHSSDPIMPTLELIETAVPANISADSVGHWLTQKVMVTRVTEHVKYTFIPYDLLSQQPHSSALQAAVSDGIFRPEQLLARDDTYRSFSADKARESSTVLESHFSPVEYVIAHAPVGLKGTLPAPYTHRTLPGSDRQSTVWPQLLLQSLDVPNSVDVINTGSTTLDSALSDITAAVTAARKSRQHLHRTA